MRPMISVSATTGLLDAIVAARGNPDQILSAVHLDRAAFSSSDRFLPTSTFAEIVNQAARVTNDHCFGLHFGEHFDPKNIGPLVYVVLNSPTIGATVRHEYTRASRESAGNKRPAMPLDTRPADGETGTAEASAPMQARPAREQSLCNVGRNLEPMEDGVSPGSLGAPGCTARPKIEANFS